MRWITANGNIRPLSEKKYSIKWNGESLSLFQFNVKQFFKKYWIEVEWEDGYREAIDAPKDIPQLDAYIDEIEYEANRDIIENQQQKWGDPDRDY